MNSEGLLGRESLQTLRLTWFDVTAFIQPAGEREHTYSDGFAVAISIGRRGLDERGFVLEAHGFVDHVKDSFNPHRSLGPQRNRQSRRDRYFEASPEQLGMGVARVCYDMLGTDLAEVTVSVKTRTGLATLEWRAGDPTPEFPKLLGADIDETSAHAPSLLWTRHFNAFDVEVLLGDNFRCGTPEGVESSFRCEVSLQRKGLDSRGVVVNGTAFKQAVLDHFHPLRDVGTPRNAPRTQGGSRVFVASCERLAAGVAHVAHKMLGEDMAGATVSVQNATGMVTYTWRSGDAPPVFPSIADRALTDATYLERQKAIREGRSASNYC